MPKRFERSLIAFLTEAEVDARHKGGKDRVTPLSVATARVLRAWLVEPDPGSTAQVFPTRTGKPLSRDAIEHRIAVHAATAAIR